MNYNSLALKQLKENATSYLMLGIGLVVLGTMFIFYAFTATVMSMYYLGGLLVVFGIFEGVKAFKVSKWSILFVHIFLSILYILAGLLIIINPVLNALTLTLLLAISFVLAGILKIIFAITQHDPHKNWILLGGILTLILGVLIWMQWPTSGLWVIGMFVGIDMIFTGWTWIRLSILAKKG
jgi:uncharacterized membrane protein HdeD (DUF308 family)